MSVVVIEDIDLLGEIGDDDVRLTVVVIVTKINAHAGIHAAIVGESYTRVLRSLGKRSIPIVMEQKLFHSVIGDKDILKTIAVIVVEGDAQGPPLFGSDTRSLTNISEGSIAVVVVQNISRCGKGPGRAIGLKTAAADFVFRGAPLHISSN